MSLQALYEEMNTFLADQIVLGMKIHNLHWFLIGDDFFPMHEKLDEYYEDAQERIDEVAERLLMIGAKPLPNLQEVLQQSNIKEWDNRYKKSQEGIASLLKDFEYLRNFAHRIIKIAGEQEDFGTEDLFTEILADLEKDIWMFKAYTHR